MTIRFADRVVETTLTTGTGTLDLEGAVAGYRGFWQELTSGDQVHYCIEDDPAAPTAYEIGVGTFVAGAPHRLTRDAVLKSSSGGSKISLLSGTTHTVTAVLTRAGMEEVDLVRYGKLDASGSMANDVRGRVAKAWVRFAGPTAAVASSFGVSSVTRMSAGFYRVNLAGGAVPDGNYATFASSSANETSIASDASAGSVYVTTAGSGGVLADANNVTVVIFGV